MPHDATAAADAAVLGLCSRAGAGYLGGPFEEAAMPIKLKKIKVDTKVSSRKSDAEKAATAAANAAFGKAKVPKEKSYEVEMTVKLEVDKTEVKASVSDFLLTERGEMVPGVSRSKSGTASSGFRGDEPPAKVVADVVDGIVADFLDKLIKVLEKLK
jgi:hypothetical protein